MKKPESSSSDQVEKSETLRTLIRRYDTADSKVNRLYWAEEIIKVLRGPVPQQPLCPCERCQMAHFFEIRTMPVCSQCGDKRCPKADDHRNECDT